MNDYSKYGDRAPAIFYNKAGYLGFRNAVSGIRNSGFNFNIKLNKLYQIEISQEDKAGKVFYTVKLDGKTVKSVENKDARAFKDVKVFAGDNFYDPADGSYSNLIWESSPGSDSEEIQKNHQLATIEEWGPLFKVSFDLMIHSNVDSTWSSVLAFRGNGAVDDWSQYGDRAPAIFYNKAGYLHFTNAVNGNRNYHFNFGIELNKLYHIEINQEEKNGKVGKL